MSFPMVFQRHMEGHLLKVLSERGKQHQQQTGIEIGHTNFFSCFPATPAISSASLSFLNENTISKQMHAKNPEISNRVFLCLVQYPA